MAEVTDKNKAAAEKLHDLATKMSLAAQNYLDAKHEHDLARSEESSKSCAASNAKNRLEQAKRNYEIGFAEILNGGKQNG